MSTTFCWQVILSPARLKTGDPVIPFDDFRQWRLPPSAALEVTRWGGHCAFVESLSGDGFAERWVADRLGAALPRR